MPIYDYTCGACGRVTEVIHGIHDTGPRYCPACGAEGSMRKALTAPAVVFKGSGWAKVDRRSSTGGHSSGSGASKRGSGATSREPAKPGSGSSGSESSGDGGSGSSGTSTHAGPGGTSGSSSSGAGGD